MSVQSTEYLPEEKLVAFAISHADRDTPRYPRKGKAPGRRAARAAFAHDLGTGRIKLTPSQLRAARLVHKSAYLARVKLIEAEEQTAREVRHLRRTGQPWTANAAAF